MGKDPTFRFRQFTLQNTASAMKIGTDGVLLGAWADTEGVSAALDIGTGTGLIALMIAQRTEAASVHGVEIDPAAAAEAARNMQASPWPHRLSVSCSDITALSDTYGTYDLIVSNPPFFTSELKAPAAARACARHEGSLSLPFLTRFASGHLTPGGRISLVLPADRLSQLRGLAVIDRLSIVRLTHVVTRQGKQPKRMLCELSPTPAHTEETTLVLTGSDGAPTAEMQALTSEFYL